MSSECTALGLTAKRAGKLMVCDGIILENGRVDGIRSDPTSDRQGSRGYSEVLLRPANRSQGTNTVSQSGPDTVVPQVTAEAWSRYGTNVSRNSRVHPEAWMQCDDVRAEGPRGPPSALDRPVPNTRQPRKIRYTGAEWGRIMELARASGRPPARYVRETSLGTVPKARRSRENDDLIYELGRIGTILNRLAAAAKASGIASHQTTIEAALTELLTAVRRLG